MQQISRDVGRNLGSKGHRRSLATVPIHTQSVGVASTTMSPQDFLLQTNFLLERSCSCHNSRPEVYANEVTRCRLSSNLVPSTRTIMWNYQVPRRAEHGPSRTSIVQKPYLAAQLNVNRSVIRSSHVKLGPVPHHGVFDFFFPPHPRLAN